MQAGMPRALAETIADQKIAGLSVAQANASAASTGASSSGGDSLAEKFATGLFGALTNPGNIQGGLSLAGQLAKKQPAPAPVVIQGGSGAPSWLMPVIIIGGLGVAGYLTYRAFS